MLIRVALEYGVRDRILAWGLDFPGCFAYGQDEAEALLNLTRNLLAYEAWIGLHAEEPWFNLVNPDFRIVEVAKPANSNVSAEKLTPTAFFTDDHYPLAQEEVERTLLIHSWQSEELLAGLEFLPEEAASRFKRETGRTISEQVSQLAQEQYMIVEALSPALPPFPSEKTGLEQFEFMTALVQAVMPAWVGDETVREWNGETWSARKAVRRLLWHQREGIDRIKAFIG